MRIFRRIRSQQPPTEDGISITLSDQDIPTGPPEPVIVQEAYAGDYEAPVTVKEIFA